MKNSFAFLPGSLLVFLTSILPASYAFAALDEFKPYVFTRVVHDSNLFRDDNNEESETIGHLGLGIGVDWKLSRQHLLLDAEADRTEYNDFDELDHTRIRSRATWAWQVGNLWNGNLGYMYNDVLSSFEQLNVREKDLRTTQGGFFEARYLIHPDWTLKVGLNAEDVSYEERRRLDRDTTSRLFEVLYRNTLNTRVGLRVTYSDYDLQNEVVGGAVINNDYDETEYSGVFYWEGTGKSAFELSVGYTNLEYDDLDALDFRGSTGRLTYHYLVTSKTKLNISVWRETSSLSNEIASYVLTKGVSIEPVWSATSKIKVTGGILFENDDYEGQNALTDPLGLPSRDDDLVRFNITANWNPRRFLDLSLGYRWVDRDSSINTNDFKANQVNAKVKFRF